MLVGVYIFLLCKIVISAFVVTVCLNLFVSEARFNLNAYETNAGAAHTACISRKVIMKCMIYTVYYTERVNIHDNQWGENPLHG